MQEMPLATTFNFDAIGTGGFVRHSEATLFSFSTRQVRSKPLGKVGMSTLEITYAEVQPTSSAGKSSWRQCADGRFALETGRELIASPKGSGGRA